MTEILWKKGTYLEAYSCGPITVEGHLHKGLALRKVANASIKTGHLPTYCLNHCGTGHRVLRIIAHRILAFKIATEIADAGDWSFTSLDDEGRKLLATTIKFIKSIDRAASGIPVDMDAVNAGVEGLELFPIKKLWDEV